VLAFAGLIAIAPAKAQDKSLEGVPVAPQIVAEISVSGQSMSVRVDGIVRYTWDVSTARRGFITPKGTFGVQSMRRMHYSSLFNNAPMPFSIFYSGHYAIHGTTEVQRLGQPASAGCVRLHPDNAKTLFEMVQERGPKSLQVVVTS
jgi:lipoprotein-anchoring transpeptidase ErfK/SrfK